MLRYLFVLCFLAATIKANYTCPNPKDFDIAFSTNQKGDIELIGNTIMCQEGNNNKCSDPGDARNNNIDMIYIDIDNSNETFNISGAKFEIPAGAEVLWAGLYWQGYLVNKTDTLKQSSSTVKLGYDTDNDPKNLTYTDINATNHNWVYFSASRFYYQGFHEITEYVKNRGNGWYYVGNIVSDEGDSLPGGGYGAWSIAIVYKDSSQSLKNLTIYDGYKGIVTSGDNTDANNYANNNNCSEAGVANEMDISLSGFLTPTNGSISSRFFIFAGEGDKTAQGDHLRMTKKDGTFVNIEDSVNPDNDLFNSTISRNGNHLDDQYLVPHHSNNSNGIDIDIFDISNIIENEQTTTTVRLDTNGDGYMPGVFGFSTELYEPRVCYVQEIQNPQIESGDVLEFEIYIKNEPEDNETLEDAQGIQITTVFDEYLDYNATSYSYLEFDGNKTITYWVGDGASMNNGGTLKPNDFALVELNATIDFVGDINITNEYFVSYRNDTLGLEFTDVAIDECKDFNNSISIAQPPTGAFSIVHTHSPVYSSYPEDGTDPNNALYTQITNQTFAIDIVSLDDSDKTTPESFTGNMIIELIDGSGIDETQLSCENATTLRKYYPTSPTSNWFNDEVKKTFSGVNYNRADRDVRFRIKYMNFGKGAISFDNACEVSNTSANIFGVPQCLNSFSKLATYFPDCAYDANGNELDICKSNMQANSGGGGPYTWKCYECIAGYNPSLCSRDNFAIRPAQFAIDVNSVIPDPMIAAQDYTIQIDALDAVANNDIGYDQNISVLSTVEKRYFRDMSVDTGGLLAGDMNITAGSDFINGVSTNTVVSYSDVGAVEVSFVDSDWAVVDSKDNAVQPNPLEINGTLSFRAIPDRFDIGLLSFDNHEGGGYTYLSDDANISAMSAKIRYNISALNADGDVTQNYSDQSANMWEQNVTIDANLTSNVVTYADNNATFKPMANMDINFTNGVAVANATDTEVIEFNFMRDPNSVHEPFEVNASMISDFNVHIIDTDSVEGNSSTVANSSSFYYANLYAPDIKTTDNPVDAELYIEVYCQQGSGGVGCDGFGLNTPSVDRINWWHFTSHQSTSGTLDSSAATGNVSLSNQPTNLNATDTIRAEYNGSENYYKTKVTLQPSSWLSYHKHIPYTITNNQQNFFFIQWNLGDAQWAGSGTLGEAVDNNTTNKGISRDNNNRINW